jgi:nitrate/nitrite transport system permease protein
VRLRFATLIAIPCGMLLGMNQGLYRAANPVIQLLKPVSPLAWLPLITLVVSALYANPVPGSPSPSSPRR